MTILISDARVRAVPVRDSGEALVRLPCAFGGAEGDDGADGRLVRASLALRLDEAQRLLPDGLHLQVKEGFRAQVSQRRIIEEYAGRLRVDHPDLTAADLERLTSRYVAPLDVAPHVAGAAVDVTLADETGRELDLGCPLDATPEESGGRCYLSAPGLSVEATANRAVLALVLGAVGLVNYPTEWWHWSYGDRYWAMVTGAPHALFGPVADGLAA
jgi:D-alanyl-D-alanine dipeptidase